MPARIALMIAVVVCAINPLLYAVSGRTASWIVISALFLTALAVLSSPMRARLYACRIRPVDALILAVCAGLAAWRLFSLFGIGFSTPFEGTGNHDDLWYVIDADWIFSHSLSAPFPSDPSFPLSFTARSNIGATPRVGAESLLVLAASLTGRPIVAVYEPVFALGSVLQIFAASLGLLYRPRAGRGETVLAFATIALSPFALFIFANNNYATCWGLVFLGGFYWSFRQMLWMEGGGLAAAIFLAALIVSYPELLPIAFLSAAVLCGHAYFASPRRELREVLKPALLGGVLALVLAPAGTIGAIKVVGAALTAARGQEAGHIAQAMDLFTPANFMLVAATYDDTQIWEGGRFVFDHFGPAGVVASTIILLAVLCLVPRLAWRAFAGLILGCLVMLAGSWFADFRYGCMKALQFLSLPLSALFGIAVAEGVFRLKKPLGLLSVLTLAILSFISLERTLRADQFAQTRNLSRDLLGLAQAENLFKPDDLLYVDDDLGTWPLPVSRWAAAMLPHTAMTFAPSLQPGGYFYHLEEGFPDRLKRVTHVLARAGSPDRTASPPLFANAGYQIWPVAGGQVLFGQGFERVDGGQRWMGQEGTLYVYGRCVDHVRLALTGSALDLTVEGGQSQHLALSEGQGAIDLAVPAGVYLRAISVRSAEPHAVRFGPVETFNAAGCVTG